MHQCPMAGGNSVFATRALYALADKSKSYNDFIICEEANIELRKAETKTDKPQRFMVRPNPANDKATLEYELKDKTKGEFKLFTMTGQQVYRATLPWQNGAHTFSTSQLYPAVYQYVILNDGVLVNVGKLVIIR
jgi:hypothetical protein